MSDITRLLDAAAAGNRRAAADLLPLVYDELRALAARKLAAERPGQTLNATALVHEAYLRLVSAAGEGAARADTPDWDGRGHVFAAAAEAMRRMLVEAARRKGRLKRGDGRRREPQDLDALPAADPDGALLDLHEALEQFAAREPDKAKLVELRYFGGLTLEQAAKTLGISPSTADRTWRYARAWVYAAVADNSEKRDAWLTCSAPRRRMAG